RGAVFVDSGALWGYRGETQDPTTGEINGTIFPQVGNKASLSCQCGMQYTDSPAPRASAGASIIWDSPFGPLRFDFAYPFIKQNGDPPQFFASAGGTKF